MTLCWGRLEISLTFSVRFRGTKVWTMAQKCPYLDWGEFLQVYVGIGSPTFLGPLSCRTWMSEQGKVGAAVEMALKEGYVLIDSAHAYDNEAEIGMALQKCIAEGIVKREGIFITSKLW